MSIDRESSEHLNIPDNPDKWPRSLHGRLVEKLVREGAKVITFDVHFLEPRSMNDDILFAEAVKKSRNVVLADALLAKEVPSLIRGDFFGRAQHRQDSQNRCPFLGVRLLLRHLLSYPEYRSR